MPLLLVALGLAAVAALAIGSNKSQAPGHTSGHFDATLPDDVDRAVSIALETEKDPQRLRSFAGSLRPEFPIAAAALESAASAIEALHGIKPAVPVNVPPAPVPLPTPPNAPPVVIPPVPPVFVPVNPPSPPNPIIPPQPQIPPSNPPQPPAPPAPNQAAIAFDPGAVPILPAIPAAGANKTDAHRIHQNALVNFYARNDVVYPVSGAGAYDPGGALRDPSGNGTIQFTAAMVDGSIGKRSQLATWAFQRFANDMMGANLIEDGLPGPNTTTALVTANSGGGVS